MYIKKILVIWHLLTLVLVGCGVYLQLAHRATTNYMLTENPATDQPAAIYPRTVYIIAIVFYLGGAIPLFHKYFKEKNEQKR